MRLQLIFCTTWCQNTIENAFEVEVYCLFRATQCQALKVTLILKEHTVTFFLACHIFHDW